MTNSTLPVIEPTYTIAQVAEMAKRSYTSVNRDINAKLLSVVQNRKNGRRTVRHSEALRYINGVSA